MYKLSILGVFWDGYQDIWLDFISLLKKNWNDCPFDIYIVNNVALPVDSTFDGVHFLNAGQDAEYSKKVQLALEHIDSDYILVLLEDFFISKIIDTHAINELLDFIVRNDIDYYCMPMHEFAPAKEKVLFSNDNQKVFKISGKQDYTISCQPSIWKKEFLKLCIGSENYNAWIFEGMYKLPFIKKSQYLSRCVIDYSNPFGLLHGALQGKIVRRTKRLLKKNGYTLKNKKDVISKSKTIFNYCRRLLEKILILCKLTSLKKYNKKSIIKKYESDIYLVSSKVLIAESFDRYFNRDVLN